MKKTIVFCLVTALLLSVSCMAGASVNEITAYQSSDILVMYQDARIALDNAPIVSNGQIYLPASELLSLLGIENQWQPSLNTFTIGTSTAADVSSPASLDFINNFDPYQSGGKGFQVIKTKDRKTMDIAGVTYDHWLRLYDSLTGDAIGYYNLGGAYTSLTFSAYHDQSSTAYVDFYGDNDVLLASIAITGYELPVQYTIDLTNVYRLKIQTSNMYVFLFDMTIQ